MVPDCRDFDKDSKKYLFAILGFFYEFLLILQIHCKHLKTNLNIMLKPLCSKELGLADMPLAGARNRGGGGLPDSGESGRRRRGGTRGGARGRREQPAGGLR